MFVLTLIVNEIALSASGVNSSWDCSLWDGDFDSGCLVPGLIQFGTTF